MFGAIVPAINEVHLFNLRVSASSLRINPSVPTYVINSRVWAIVPVIYEVCQVNSREPGVCVFTKVCLVNARVWGNCASDL